MAGSTSATTEGADILPWALPLLALRVHILTMPVLSGLDRGLLVPFLRPSEVVQLVVMGIVAWGVITRSRGRSWPVRLQPLDGAVLTLAVLSSIVPLLWMTARGLSVTQDDLLASFPFIKYAGLYLTARLAITTRDDVRRIVTAVLTAGLLLAVISMAQLLLPAVGEALAGSFGDSQAGFTTGGRGTTTLASAIATFGVLIQAAGLSVAAWITSGRHGFGIIAAVLVLGTVATGQISGLIGLGLVLSCVIIATGSWRTVRPFVLGGLPLVAVLLIPVIGARLASTVQGTLLPSSWVTRVDNLTFYYLPELTPFRWILGVRPNAVIVPLDTWREAIYLESGYLWLIWVGGVPLLMAFVVMLRHMFTAGRAMHREADPVLATVGYAMTAAVTAIAVLSLIDPHVTMRGVADVYFVMAAATVIRRPLIDEAAPARRRRRRPSARSALARTAV